MAHADTPSLPRLRSRAVSMRTFQRMAVVTLVILWLVVTTGALVRLTASGLGCPHWPTCTANQLVPQDSSHALIEFSNRTISGLAMLAAVATAIMAYRVVGLDRRIAHALAIAAAGTVAQVPLGAVTVEFDLNPYLVISHFLLAMAVVSFSTWATVRALRPTRVAAAPAARRLGPAGLGLGGRLPRADHVGRVRDRGRAAPRQHEHPDRAAGQLLRLRLLCTSASPPRSPCSSSRWRCGCGGASAGRAPSGWRRSASCCSRARRAWASTSTETGCRGR